MTQSDYSKILVNTMLGWLKSLADSVLKLFNLSSGTSVFEQLVDHWLEIFLVLLIVGVLIDRIVWILRWRPHWIWFHRKKIVINDDDFFAGEDEMDDIPSRWRELYKNELRPESDWVDSEFTVRTGRRRRAKPADAPKEDPSAEKDLFQKGSFNPEAMKHFTDTYEDEAFIVEPLEETEPEDKKEDETPADERNDGRSE